MIVDYIKEQRLEAYLLRVRPDLIRYEDTETYIKESHPDLYINWLKEEERQEWTPTELSLARRLLEKEWEESYG